MKGNRNEHNQLNLKAMPLVEALQDYCDARPARFHIPGHAGIGQGAFASLFAGMISMDVTEVHGLDDLHQPDGCISKSQTLSAAFFGADQTYYLVGGSSAGNQALILATCQAGDLVLMQRNVHQSLIHGAMLAGVRIVWLMPATETHTGMAGGVPAETVAAAFHSHPEAKALILQHPNYYGHAREDLETSVNIAHAHDAIVLVDEAHGAHFGLHPAFPSSALSCGADAVVQSTHKMLGALSMGAMLHLQGNRVVPDRFRRALRVLQTSSPSYPVMASLDAVRGTVAGEGPQIFERMLKKLKELKNKLKTDEIVGLEIVHSDDPCKLIIRDRKQWVSGYALQDWFVSNGCVPELSDPLQTVFVVTWQTPDEDITRLESVMRLYASANIMKDEYTRVKPVRFELTDAHFSKKPVVLPSIAEWVGLSGDGEERIGLADAAGRICSDALTPYPPGIPLIFPGETLSSERIVQLTEFLRNGASVKGIFYDQVTNEPYLSVRK